MTFTGTPVEGTPPTKAVVASDVFPPEGKLSAPAAMGDKLRLAAVTEKSIRPEIGTPATSADADSEAAPRLESEAGATPTSAMPDPLVSAVVGKSVAMLAPLRSKVTKVFGTTAPVAFLNVARAANPPPTEMLVTEAPAWFTMLTTKVGEPVGVSPPVEPPPVPPEPPPVPTVPPGLPPPPPHATSSAVKAKAPKVLISFIFNP